LPSDEEPRRGPKPLVWVVIGLSAALIAALAWNFFGREDAAGRRRAGAGARAVAAGRRAGTADPGAGRRLRTDWRRGGLGRRRCRAGRSIEAGAQAGAPAAARHSAGTQPDGSRMPPTATPGPAAPRGADMATVARGNDAATATRNADAGAAPRPAEGGGDARIYALRDLPEEIRRTLPNVAVGGSTYSTDRASRMLMINGQIFHEGDVVSNGLVLQQIKPRGAVFSFKGFRYETGF
jgi:general secretion pathway protein B